MGELDYLDQLAERYPALDDIRDSIQGAYELIKDCCGEGGTVFTAGNGGSCADSEHIVGELMKSFVKQRPVSETFAAALKQVDPLRGEMLAEKLESGFPAISLTGHPALTTAYSNDVDGTMAFAQQLLNLGKSGDVLLGISTSGNAENILYAMIVAKAKGMKAIAMTGMTGGIMGRIADVVIAVPERETYKVQELHLPIYHAICLMLEEHFF